MRLEIDGEPAGRLQGNRSVEARISLTPGSHFVTGRSEEFADIEARSYATIVAGKEEKAGLWMAAYVDLKRALPRAPAEAGGKTEAAKARLLGLDLRWVTIPGGKFAMGCPRNEESCRTVSQPPRQVRISKSFLMMATPVTREQFETWALSQGYQPPAQPVGSGPDFPVVNVSWNGAQAFCSAFGARLPSDAEWEYAARVSNTGIRYGEPGDESWYWPRTPNSRFQGHPVARKRPNAFGLYDMLGNVGAWCADWYERLPSMTGDEAARWRSHQPPAAIDPAGPAIYLSHDQHPLLPGEIGERVHRGPENFFIRSYGSQNNKSEDVGFRCARGGSFPPAVAPPPDLTTLEPRPIQPRNAKWDGPPKSSGSCRVPEAGHARDVSGKWWNRTLTFSISNPEDRPVFVGVTFSADAEKTTRFYELGGQLAGSEWTCKTFSEQFRTCGAASTLPVRDYGWEVTSTSWAPFDPRMSPRP